MQLAAVARSHVEFCSYCGVMGESGARVCSDCGLGVRLRTEADALTSPGATFLVVSDAGIVSATSAAAERRFGPDAIGRPLLGLLGPVHGELAGMVARAAKGVKGVATCDLADRLRARIASCGEPAAALVVLEQAP